MSDQPRAFVVRQPQTADLPAISRLHKAAFGPGRFARTAYRVREGTPRISDFCRIAEADGEIVAALRFTPVTIGGKGEALLLGPLAVAPHLANRGYGRALVAAGLDAARAAGIRIVVLVGDVPYYGRFGFAPVQPGQITLPGPVNPARVLATELAEGALAGFSGLIVPDLGAS